LIVARLKHIALLCLLFIAFALTARSEVLIVADEFPAMRIVAAKLKSVENIDSQIIAQTNLPASLASFSAVIVYIHRDLLPDSERAFIHYATNGGKLILLHHSIGSTKRKNKDWLPFLGVTLPEGNVAQGGYKWIEPANWSLVNLDPRSFIMTNKVSYPEQIRYYSTKVPVPGGHLPGFTLTNSEVYLNQTHIGAHTLLMGLKYSDPKTGVVYLQDRAGWIKRAGKGWVIYLMPGHTIGDFENPVYSRIVLNAVICPL
jgi:hypothetical protein